MKVKYILRGLGIGMIITAVLMGIYTRSAVASAKTEALKEYEAQQEITDEESGADEALETEEVLETEDVVDWDDELEAQIISKLDEAQEQAEGKTQEENADEPADEAQDTDVEEIVEETVDASAGEAQDADGEETVDADESDLAAESVEEESVEEESVEQVETAAVVISKGDSSETVSRKLYSAGLVENANDYNAYLMQHGYDKKITTGTKEIPLGSTWLEIADLLTK